MRGAYCVLADNVESVSVCLSACHFFLHLICTHPKRAESLPTLMQLGGLFVEEHLGLGTWRLFRSHNHTGFLANVVVEQFAVGRHGQLALHSLVVIGAGRPV